MSESVEPRLNLIAVTRKPDMPSFRERIENNVDLLRERGIDVTIRVLPHGVRAQRRALDELREYDGVWWQRHLLTPLLHRTLRQAARRLVFDYDDPVRYSARGGGRASFSRRLGFAAMTRRADAVFAGSQWLASLAEPYCPNIYIVPMPVAVPEEITPHPVTDGTVELFWFGSRTTQEYLEEIRGALSVLGRRHPQLRLRIVAPEPFEGDGMGVDNRAWSMEEEECALRECHIGLCPMPDTLWTRGKCPYKVLRYMAYAMPWVGSAVGENLVTAGEGDDARGLCAANDEAWVEAIERLAEDEILRRELGARAHGYVQEHHRRDALADLQARAWREIVARSD